MFNEWKLFTVESCVIDGVDMVVEKHHRGYAGRPAGVARQALDEYLTKSCSTDIVVTEEESRNRYVFTALCEKKHVKMGPYFYARFDIEIRHASPRVICRDWLTFYPDNTALAWNHRPQLWDDALLVELFTSRAQERILRCQATGTSNILTMALPSELVLTIWDMIDDDRRFSLVNTISGP